MKLIIVLMTTCLLQVSAAGFAQKVTYAKKGATLEQIFGEIRKQTGYFVVYAEGKVNKQAKLDVNFRNTDLTDVLDVISKSQDLSYSVNEKNIGLKPKENSFLADVIARFQAIDVRGKVVDSLGNGLAGATVSVKGSKASTFTSANGNFYLKNVDGESVLIVSYLGYVTREIKISKEFIYIQLQQSNSKLDEVKVIAYGLTSQRLSTGNITTVNAADIEKQPVNNPLYTLQGRVPGLQITPITGLAGGAVNVQIRGKNSLSSGSEPLIVIDGMPVKNNIAGLNHDGYYANGSGSQFSSLSFINPNDIESISVLKDADATSIYGSRGANGVILITTKKGKAGDVTINLDAKQGISNVPRTMALLNTNEYLALRLEAFENSDVDPNSFPYNTDILRKFLTADVTVWDANRFTDWQKELIGQTAHRTDFQGSIGGGQSGLSYSISGNFSKDATVFAGDNSDRRGSAKMTISGSSKDQRLKSTFTALYMYNKNTLPGIDFTNLALTLPPNAPSLYSSDGSLNWELLPSGARSWDNPYSQLAKSYEGNVRNLITSAEFSYTILKGLVLKTRVGFNDLRGNAFRKRYPFEGRPPEELNINSAGATFSSIYSQNVNIEPQIIYNLNMGNSHFDVLSGSSYQANKDGSENLDADGATSDALLQSLESYTQKNLRNTSSEYKYAALFGRIGYNWKNKYLASGTIRRDGSSRFGPGNQYGTFGSGAVAWVFSEEEFIKKYFSFLSFGKVRASYGSSGNDGIGDYQYLERYSAYSVLDLYQGAIGYSTSGIFNPYYAWEVTKKLEMGFEIGLFKDRLFLAASYYQNRSNNQLLAYPLASINGPGSLLVNLPACIQNSGAEFSVQTDNIKGTLFSWSTNINLSTNSNELLSYPDIESSSYSHLVVGEPFNGVLSRFNYGYVNMQTGIYEFYKQDGSVTSNPYVTDKIDGGAFLRVNSLPKFYGGIANSFKYRNFSLDIFLQFSKQIAISPISQYARLAGRMSNLPFEYTNRWQKSGDKTDIQRVFQSLPDDYERALSAYENSNKVDVDASFLRLKNLSFAYQFSDAFSSKLGVKSLVLSLQGQNIATITSYKGLDPETRSIGNLPPLRTLMIGLRITL